MYDETANGQDLVFRNVEVEMTSLCARSVLEEITLLLGLWLGSHTALLRLCSLASLMQCNLLIIVLLSYAVEAYTFTQAIAIELLRHFRSVHNAPRALQQFVQQTLTGSPLSE